MPEIRLAFEGVTKRFAPQRGRAGEQGVTAIEGVTVAVAAGEVVSIIGPSGCGKSTLLNLASGLDRPSAGRVFVDGEQVSGPNAHVAFMLQKDMLLPWRTIQENAEFGLEIQSKPPATRRQKARALLEKYHLGEFLAHYPHQLSGGMRQRAALARTMAMDPDVLLLDEPFSALDAQTKMVLQQDLAATLAEERKTALLITHDLSEAAALSDRVLVMSRRPGRIVHEIVVDLPDRDRPMARRATPGVARIIGELMALLDIGRTDRLDG
jgi:NitT/TauT family transport system ATP-binding protein